MEKRDGLALLLAHLLIILGLIVVEFYLREVTFGSTHLVYPPGQATAARAAFDIGLKGNAKFSVNSMGLRGSELTPWHDMKILILGSSGALGWMLDDSETWPSLLKKRWVQKKVWTGNAGHTGNRLIESHIHLKHFLAKDFRPDLVLSFATGLELFARLYQGKFFTPNFLDSESEIEAAYAQAFSIQNGPFSLQNLALVEWIKRFRENSQINVLPPSDYFVRARTMRMQARKINEAPTDMGDLYGEVEHHMKAMARLAHDKNVRLIFVTRPTLWSVHLSKKEEESLWLGFAGDNKESQSRDKVHKEYYSTSVMYELMNGYNEAVLAICKREQLECIDLAAQIEKKAVNFFDDSHLTPQGSKEVAGYLLKYLRQP